MERERLFEETKNAEHASAVSRWRNECVPRIYHNFKKDNSSKRSYTEEIASANHVCEQILEIEIVV